MRRVAAQEGAVFVDLLVPSLAAMQRSPTPWTMNGIHMNAHGNVEMVKLLDAGLFGPAIPAATTDMGKLLAAVNEKNLQ